MPGYGRAGKSTHHQQHSLRSWGQAPGAIVNKWVASSPDNGLFIL